MNKWFEPLKSDIGLYTIGISPWTGGMSHWKSGISHWTSGIGQWTNSMSQERVNRWFWPLSKWCLPLNKWYEPGCMRHQTVNEWICNKVAKAVELWSLLFVGIGKALYNGSELALSPGIGNPMSWGRMKICVWSYDFLHKYDFQYKNDFMHKLNLISSVCVYR